jgi:hypothetical protein
VCGVSQTCYKNLKVSSSDLSEQNPLKIGEPGGLALQVDADAPPRFLKTLTMGSTDAGEEDAGAIVTDLDELLAEHAGDDGGDAHTAPPDPPLRAPEPTAFEKKAAALAALAASADVAASAEPPAAFVSEKSQSKRPASAPAKTKGAKELPSAKAGPKAGAKRGAKEASVAPVAGDAKRVLPKPVWGRIHHPQYNKKKNHETLLRKEPIDTSDGANFYKSFVEEGDAVEVRRARPRVPAHTTL